MSELIRRDAEGVVHVDADLATAIRSIALQSIRVDNDSVNAALRALDAHWRAVLDDLIGQINQALAQRSGPVVLNLAPAEPRPTVKRVEHDADGRIVAIREEPAP